MAKDEKSVIQSVDRALTLLEEIASTPGESRNLTDLSGLMGIDRSSVFRLLNTLGRHGLIRQNDGDKSYSLGLGIYKLASSLRDQLKITDLVNPYLRMLVKETGENAHLAVPAGNRCVFIDREKGTSTLSANTNIGEMEELYCTAVGKSLICRLPPNEVEALVPESSMVPYTEKTLTTLEALVTELDLTRSRGYSIDNEEYEPSVFCMATPIVNFEKKVEAAVGISGPTLRMKPEKDGIARLLKDVGEELSEKLGYRK